MRSPDRIGRVGGWALAGLVMVLTCLPSALQAQTQQAATGILRGRVVRSDTGAPIPRADVALDGRPSSVSPARGKPRVVLTDDNGRFELTAVPPGRYWLSATKDGFVTMSYGQSDPRAGARTTVTLTDGQILDGLEIALPPGAVVDGRVVDGRGDPVAGAAVQLLRREFINGELRAGPTPTRATTGDAGAFRLTGVSPGLYYLSASDSRPGGAAPGVRTAPTYYPGTASLQQAQPLSIGLGESG